MLAPLQLMAALLSLHPPSTYFLPTFKSDQPNSISCLKRGKNSPAPRLDEHDGVAGGLSLSGDQEFTFLGFLNLHRNAAGVIKKAKL